MSVFLVKVALVGGALLLSALFSLMETAFMSLTRIQLARWAKQRPGRLDFWQQDPDRSLAAILLANNLANAGVGVLSVSLALDAERLFYFPFSWGQYMVPALLAVVTILFSEVAPKVIARQYPEAIAIGWAPFLRRLTQVLAPPIEIVLVRVEGLLAWLSRTVRTERIQWNAHVIRTLLQRAPVAASLKDLLDNVLGFGHQGIRQLMVDREHVVAVDLDGPRETFATRVLASGYSRVPVYRGSLDNVEGIVYAKDLLALGRSGPLITVEDLIRPVLRVPPDTPLAKLMRIFRQGGHHLALVVDNAGRVAGVVTLQDLLEALVGEIAEEPEPSNP